MLHFGTFEIRTDIFVLLLSILFLLLQVLLCFKVKKLFLRLIPTVLFSAATVVFALMMLFSDGWDAIGFLLFTICSASFLAACGIGWGIWAIAKKLKKLNK